MKPQGTPHPAAYAIFGGHSRRNDCRDRLPRTCFFRSDHRCCASTREKSQMNTTKTPVLRKSIGEFAPKLVDLTEEVLFGDVWERPGLSKRDRSLITCAALVSTGKTEQMDFHFPNAIKNGVTQEELVEMITHLAFYVGWPNAMSAVNRAKALLAKKETP
jgi:4-carboxymuconolactone decarboxylase